MTIPALTIVLGITAWCVHTRLYVSRFLTPYAMTLLVIVAIYGLRPMNDLLAGRFDLYGLDYKDGYFRAVVVGFVALVALIVGHSVAGPSHAPTAHSEREASSSTCHRVPKISATMVAVVGLNVAWFGAYLLVGGPAMLRAMYGGRSSDVATSLAHVPVFISTMPVAAAILYVYQRVRSVDAKSSNATHSFGETLQYWSIILLCTVPSFALGNRRFIVPCVIAGLVGGIYGRLPRRVSVRAFTMFVLVFIVASTIPYVRSAGSRTDNETLPSALVSHVLDEGPVSVISRPFASHDTEMFGYVAVVADRLGDELPYGMGRATVGDLVLNPLPEALGFTRWSDKVLQNMYGSTCAQGVCPVQSLPGAFYLDFGLPFVALGMFLVGIVARRSEGLLYRRMGSGKVIVLVGVAFTPVIARGNSMESIYLAILVAFIAYALARILPKRRVVVPRGVQACLDRRGAHEVIGGIGRRSIASRRGVARPTF